jgi:hypothetical protein
VFVFDYAAWSLGSGYAGCCAIWVCVLCWVLFWVLCRGLVAVLTVHCNMCMLCRVFVLAVTASIRVVFVEYWLALQQREHNTGTAMGPRRTIWQPCWT